MKTGNDASDGFAYLLLGLKNYSEKNFLEIPSSLRRSMNELAFMKHKKFPKTMREFLQLCHQELDEWYPIPIDDFDTSQPLLYDSHLSEEAHEYFLTLIDEWEIEMTAEVNQDILDNAKMKKFRRSLQAMPERNQAQDIYIAVRSFLIEHSCVHLDALRDEYEILEYLKLFYEEIPSLPVNELKICPRCGLLRWQNQQWRGIKPSYCNQHGPNATLLSISEEDQLYRLKPVIHERVFIAGQIEKALFTLAEGLLDERYLLSSERYPGIDTYDLRLTFSDKEVWAIDAKDQASTKLLGHQLTMPFAEGGLTYTHAFYVLPDKRMEEKGYREALEANRQIHAPNLFVLSFTEFKDKLENKIETLAKPARKNKKD